MWQPHTELTSNAPQCTTFGYIALRNATLIDVFWQIWSGPELAAGRLLWRSWKDFIACVTKTSLWQTLSRLIQTVVELHFKQVALHLYPVRKKQFNTTLWKRIQCVGIQWSAVKMFGAQKAASVFPEYSRHPSECSEDAIDSAAWWRWSS